MAAFSRRDSRSPAPRGSQPAPRARGETRGPDEFADPAASGLRAPAPVPNLPGSRSHPARNDEIRICGLAAVRARFARDPGSIQRLFFDYETGRQVGVISKVLAQSKRIYRCVEPAELEKVAGTVHHGGIVAVVTARPLRAAGAAEAAAWAAKREALVILDRIGNAHNLGAIARTAAFFGVARIVIPDDPAAAKPNDAAYRVAEGGLEQLEVWRTPRVATFVRELAAAGYDVVGAATHGATSLRPRGARRETETRPPIALVLGNEELGLAADVAAGCTRRVTIPGRGRVDSLNVSVAAAVLLWELLAREGG